jgi:hypothetical protein
MTKIELGALISRIFALYCVVYSVIFMGSFFFAGLVSMFDPKNLSGFMEYLVANVLVLLGYIVPGYFLWFKAKFVGRLLTSAVSDSAPETLVSKITYEEGMRYVFVIMGLIFILHGVPSLTQVVHSAINCFGGCGFDGFDRTSFYSSIIYILIGSGIITGSKALQSGVQSVREKGVDLKPRDEDESLK